MTRSQGALTRRRVFGVGAVLTATTAVVSLSAGVTGNWLASIEVPGFFGTVAGKATAFGLAIVLTVGLAVAASRSPRVGAADAGVSSEVRVVPGDGSADKRFEVWSMGEFTPVEATVHTAIGRRFRSAADVGDSAHSPPYVLRDYDTELAADISAAVEGRLQALIILRGRSSTGKTRSLYEAVHARCGAFQVIRPLSRAALLALPGSGHLQRGPSVVWLNELQGFVGTNGTALSRSLLADLFAASPTALVVVGTVWPDTLREATREDEQTRDTRELLTGVTPLVRWHEVPDRFSASEVDRAREVAARTRDERLTDAVADRNQFGVTQTLAGAHELVEHYNNAAPPTRLVLEAAADVRRLGMESALPAMLLEAVALALWHEERGPTQPPDAWFSDALTDATQALRSAEGGVRALIPVAHDEQISAPSGATATDARQPAGYTLADYLQQHLTSTRRTHIVGDAVWEALHNTANTDLLQLARAARKRGRAPMEGRLLARATIAGEVRAHSGLADFLVRQGRHDEVEQVWRDAIAAGDRFAHSGLVAFLVRLGRHDEVEQVWRDAIAAGEKGAHRGLAKFFDRQGRHDEVEQVWRDAIAAGDRFAHRDLADFLDRQGRHDEAEQAWRDTIVAGEVDAHNGLANLLDRQGRHDEVEQVWRDAIAAGDRFAHRDLADFLDRQGRHDEAEQAWRDTIAAGKTGAHNGLANLLDRQSRHDEAEQVWRDAIAAGDRFAHGDLAALLGRQGHHDEAEQVWRDAIAAGKTGAHRNLAAFLDRQGHHDEAEQVWRDAIAAGKTGAHRNLAAFLDRQGHHDEVEQVWRDAIASGEVGAHIGLAMFLGRQGRHDEAEQVWRDAIAATEGDAHRDLANFLDRQSRHDEAEQVWRDGIAAGERGDHGGLAENLVRQGRLDEAEQVWRDAIAAGERYAHRNLAEFLVRQGHHDEAEQVWRDAIAAGEGGAHRGLAKFFDRQGRRDEAE